MALHVGAHLGAVAGPTRARTLHAGAHLVAPDIVDRILGDFYLGLPPGAPIALYGHEAPRMLGNLPSYYYTSTFVRALLQAEGYEIDYIWDLTQSVIPRLTHPKDCPAWVLPMWEAMLRLPGRSTWTDAERRASVEARIGLAVQEADIKKLLAVEARCIVGALSFGYSVDYQVDITTTGLSAGQKAIIASVGQLVIPAHMSFTVDGTMIR